MRKDAPNLSLAERQVIYSMLQSGKKDSEIAKALGNGRVKSTVWREKRRKKPLPCVWNEMTPLERAAYMQEQVNRNHSEWKRGSRRRLDTVPVQEIIHNCIEKGKRSPEQTAEMIGQREDVAVKLSGKTVRRYIDKEAPELKKFLPFKGKRRRRRAPDTSNGMKPYAELPFAAATRSRYGDLEIDLIVCSQSSVSILVVRERVTRLVFLRRVENRQADTLRQALFKLLGQIPACLRQSGIFDRDKAFSDLHSLAKYYELELYACDAYCSWQKGAVENANQQVRRFLPKGTDLSAVSQERLNEIAHWINITPMAVLGGLSPIQAWEMALQAYRDSLH